MSRLSTYEDKMSRYDSNCIALWVGEIFPNTDGWETVDEVSDTQCEVKTCIECNWQKNNLEGLLNDLSEPME